MTNPPAPRVSWVLLVVLLAALATGAAASILVGASTAPPPASGPSSLVLLPLWVIMVAAVGVLVFVVASLLVLRLTSSTVVSLNRPAVVALVAILLGVVFVLVTRLLTGGGSFSTSPANSTGGTGSSSGSGSGPGGNVTGPGGHLVLFPSLPGWVPFLLLGIVALIVVVVAVPRTLEYLAEGRERGTGRRSAAAAAAPGLRAALTRASTELDLGGDPRTVILDLYAEILERLTPMVGEIGTSTPEEIRVGHLVRLGVRPGAAVTLTRLFEEARYSTHPMGPKESTRAQEAVRETLEDLDRRNLPA